MKEDLWQTPDADAYIEWAEQYTDAQRAQMTTLKPFLAGCRAASTRTAREIEILWQMIHEKTALMDAVTLSAARSTLDERARLRPLLERCLDLVESVGWRIQYQERVQVLISDLRCELERKEGHPLPPP